MSSGRKLIMQCVNFWVHLGGMTTSYFLQNLRFTCNLSWIVSTFNLSIRIQIRISINTPHARRGKCEPTDLQTQR